MPSLSRRLQYISKNHATKLFKVSDIDNESANCLDISLFHFNTKTVVIIVSETLQKAPSIQAICGGCPAGHSYVLLVAVKQ